jgi:transcription antitermination factor NusG
MFPGYVLVRAAPAHFHRIARIPGVHGLVSFGGEPASLDDAVVDFLRARAGTDGVVECDPLPPGAEVRIIDGPLAGLVAVLAPHATRGRVAWGPRPATARERVSVLLDLLRRRTRVELPANWITPL